MSKIKMAWALCSDNLSKIHILNNKVVRNNNNNQDDSYKYLCFCHNLPVLAVKGDVNEKHFRHVNDSLDNLKLYKEKLHSYNETIVHKLGKKVFSELTNVILPNNSFEEEKYFYNNYPWKKDLLGNIFKIEIPKIIESYSFQSFPSESLIEKPINSINIIPDVQIKLSHPELMPEPLFIAIEIFVSHALDDDKINKYKSINMPCIQVDLSGFLDTVNQSLDIDFESLIKQYILKLDIYDYPFFNFIDKLNLIKKQFNEKYQEKLDLINHNILIENTKKVRYSIIDSKPSLLHNNNSSVNYHCPECNVKIDLIDNNFIHPFNDCKIFHLKPSFADLSQVLLLKSFIKNCFDTLSSWTFIELNPVENNNGYVRISANKNQVVYYDFYIDTIFYLIEKPIELISHFEKYLSSQEEYDNREKRRKIRLIEKQIIFSFDGEKIIHVNSAKKDHDYRCLCCNQLLRLQILSPTEKYFFHQNNNFDCDLFSIKNPLDFLIPKVINNLNFNSFTKSINNQNYLIKFKYINNPKYGEININCSFFHTNIFNTKEYDVNCLIRIQYLINSLNDISNNDFIESLWFRVELSIKQILQTEKESGVVEIGRFNQISSFLGTGINSLSYQESFCPLCCGIVIRGKHHNRYSKCSMLNYSNDDWNHYYEKLKSMKDVFEFLVLLKNSNKKYPMTSWINFFKSYGINVENLQFKFISVYFDTSLKNRKEIIEFWIEINSKKFLCAIGLTSKNKFYKDLYFQFNQFNQTDFKNPIDVSLRLINYLKSI